LSLAIYLRCFAAVELMEDNRHRIPMAQRTSSPGSKQCVCAEWIQRIRSLSVSNPARRATVIGTDQRWEVETISNLSVREGGQLEIISKTDCSQKFNQRSY